MRSLPSRWLFVLLAVLTPMAARATRLAVALAVGAVAFAPIAARGASPSFGSFYTNHFNLQSTNAYGSTIIKINTNAFPSLAGTNIFNYTTNIIENSLTIITNSITTNTFSTNYYNYTTNIIDNSTLIITNTTVIINGTNSDLTQLWTNNLGNYEPVTPQDTITVTNLRSYKLLTSFGGFMLPTSLDVTLNAGVNNLSMINVGSERITGFDTNAFASTVQLSAGNGQGQIVILQNAGTNAFTINNGLATWDDPTKYVRLNGDWSPTTEGESLLLYNTGPFWTEIARLNGDTNTISDALWVAESGVLHPIDLTNTTTVPLAFDVNSTHAASQVFTVHGENNNRAVQIINDHILLENNLQNDIGTNSPFLAHGLTLWNLSALQEASPQENSPGVDWIGGAWATNLTTGQTVAYSAWVNALPGADNASGAWILQSKIGADPAATALTVSSDSGYTGTGANFLSDDGTFKAAAMPADLLWTNNAGILQPKDLTLPLYWTNKVTLGRDGSPAINFGAGDTNVLYRSGTALYYTNAAPNDVQFIVQDGSAHNLRVGLNSSGGGYLKPSSGALYVDASTGTLFSGPLLSFGSSWDIGQANTVTWKDIYENGKHYFYGYGPVSGTNYSRFSISHSGTNGAAILNSTSAGTAGDPRPVYVNIGGTNMVQFAVPTATNETSLLLFDLNSGAVQRVTAGANDSGGSGFRQLLIPNF